MSPTNRSGHNSPLLWRATPVLLAAAAIAWLALRPPQSAEPAEWSPLVAAVAEGDTAAGAALAELAARDWPGTRPRIVAALEHPAASVRAIATGLLADREPETAVRELLIRASDDDYRVRAAAFAGLDRLQPVDGGMPGRDTPLAERDRRLRAWIAGYPVRDAPPDATRLQCGLHLHPEHLRLSAATIDGCLQCHVGPRPPASMHPLAQDCLACHPRIHHQWSGSAHANSVSHLTLRSVDPQTRQPLVVQPASPGLHCVACHAIDADDNPRGCVAPFARSGAESCIACHGGTAGEWRAWSAGPRPAQSNWLPGELQWSEAGRPATCIDCHMTTRSASEANWPDHRWAARRDRSLLAAALHVDAIPLVSTASVRLTITNLAGHAFPTALERRAIELWVDTDDEATPRRVMRFGPSLREGENGLQPALAPAEQRAVEVAIPPGTRALRWRLVYSRNRHDPSAMREEFAAGRVAIHE